MNTKKTISLYATLSGGFLLGVLALLYSIKRKRASAAQSKAIRDQFLAVLKSLKREQYSDIITIQKMVSDLAKFGTFFSAREKNQVMKMNRSQAETRLAQTKLKVLEKHKIQEKDYSCCLSIFQDDKEVQELIAALDQRIEDAFDGNDIDLSTTIPEILTPSKLLEIRKDICKEICRKSQSAYKEMKVEFGEVNLEGKQATKYQELVNIDQIENTIFTNYSLDVYEETASQIFRYATEKYSKESEKFKADLVQIDLNFTDCNKALQNNPNQEEGYIEKFFERKEETQDEDLEGGLFD